MQNRSHFVFIIVLLATFSLAPAGTSDHPSPQATTTNQASIIVGDRTQMPDALGKLLASDPERLLVGIVHTLRRHSPDGVATPESIARVERDKRARWREQYVSDYLEFDGDGDGALSAAELQRMAELKRRRHLMVRRIPVIDIDGDGMLSAEEILAEAEWKAVEVRERIRNSDAFEASNLMLFDQDSDGAVHMEEVVALGRSLATAATGGAAEGDGEEFLDVPPVCSVPRPPEDAKVLVLDGYDGDALSSVALRGRDSLTTVARVIVEPGEAPLYILARADRIVIWKLDGATERIAHFVAHLGTDGDGTGAGVAGLRAENVSFVPGEACLRGFGGSDPAAAQIAKAFLQSRLGHEVDHLIHHHRLRQIRLPSGANEEGTGKHRLTVVRGGQEYEVTITGMRPVAKGTGGPPPGFDRVADPTTARELVSFYPGGVIRLDAGAVVAPVPVEAYDVLPQQAGLLQLIEEGALQRTPTGEYLIARPIPRFPAVLGGAHAVRFVLAPGVPMPGGDPVHSTVVRQGTGECLAGPTCRN